MEDPTLQPETRLLNGDCVSLELWGLLSWLLAGDCLLSSFSLGTS